MKSISKNLHKHIKMKHPLIPILALLTCATSLAQSVIVKGTGAGAVLGTVATATNVVSVLTNLVVTGDGGPSSPNGTNYVQIADYREHPAWSNTVVSFFVFYYDTPTEYRLAAGFDASEGWDSFVETTPTGLYYSYFGDATGTPTVAYWYQTNYPLATVTVQGKVTP